MVSDSNGTQIHENSRCCSILSLISIEHWESWLVENGMEIESKLKWIRGGKSSYFREPDKYLIELATPGLWAIY